MTDYLTQLLDPGADALERALRQAEHALAGGRPGETETEGEELSPVEGTTRQTSEAGRPETDLSPKEQAGLPQGLPREAMQEAINGALRGGAEDGFTAEFTQFEAQALAGALRQADRSAAQAEILTRGAPAQSTGDRAAVENRAWTAMGRAEPGGTAAGGELETAQRVDRAFRRDSRRYDGGFFLY